MSRYFENHVITTAAPTTHNSNGIVFTTWKCSMNGTEIGSIQHSDKIDQWNPKHYSASVRVCEDDGRRGVNRVGYFDTLAAAKAALAEPAKEYLNDLRQEQQRRTPVAYLPEADSDFYPTPSKLAGELIARIDWSKVETILEPSAGKGDLLECAMRNKWKESLRAKGFYEKERVDCIEIDPNLRAILKDKGFRVVHDDFLTFDTHKRYSLILMNPPFSEGDKHLFHALELCENGGQIACIINAETIRNPYTKLRTLLINKLHSHGATIRIIPDAFKHAERSARVDVALINVEIPSKFNDTSIWDELHPAKEYDVNGDQYCMHFDMAPANNVERLIQEYDTLCKSGISLMRKFNGIAPYIQSGTDKYSSPIIRLNIGRNNIDHCGTKEVNAFLKLARVRYWQELFNLPELKNKMTSDMRSEYESTVNKMADYEFSLFNIQEVLQKISGQLTSGVESAIIKCFTKLSNEHAYNENIQNDNIHYYNGWKTNKAHKVNEKCIIPSWGCFAKGYETDKNGRLKEIQNKLDAHSCVELLDDLEKAFDYLDKGETTATNLPTKIHAAAESGVTRDIPCKYFTVTFYKKGTCHIKFTNQTVLDRLNIFVGRQKAWLPPTYGKVKYDDMSENDRRTVDEFQGRDKYDEVMRSPASYIIDVERVPLLAS